MMRLLFLLSFFIVNSVVAQNKYWIIFKDKNLQGYHYEKGISKETQINRIKLGLPLHQYSDVSVNKEYIEELQKIGVQSLVKSKWLNAVSAYLTQEQIREVSSLPCVKEVSLINRQVKVTGNFTDMPAEYYSATLKQMMADAFFQEGLTGRGVTIGVIDAGFFQAVKDKNLAHLFSGNKIVTQKDFLDSPINDLVRDSVNFTDTHGRQVLSWICGYDSSTKTQIGLALNAKFYLARTENEAREYRGEEDNWMMAMEWMDSLGVRLINTSLGYSINMDDPADNYKMEDMNGTTTRIAQAAQRAVNEKGIFLVVSAGNEGGNPNWKIISSPADVEGVLAIGATKDKTWEKIGYSSIGPEFLSYLKPNVSCFSLYGTSFSAPAITGFVACLMEKDPSLTNKDLKEIVEKSGHLYPYGNNYIGYGVPQADRALKLMNDKNHEFKNCVEKSVKGKKATFKFDKGYNIDVVAFHKKNKHTVLQQQVVHIRHGRLIIKKISGAVRTTVSLKQEVIEIVWE